MEISKEDLIALKRQIDEIKNNPSAQSSIRTKLEKIGCDLQRLDKARKVEYGILKQAVTM